MDTTLLPKPVTPHDGFYISLRELVDNEVAAHESDPVNYTSQLWQTIPHTISNTNYGYGRFSEPIVSYENDLHDLWYKLIAIAMITHCDSPEQDRLVRMVIDAREMGTLTRHQTGMAAEEAVTPAGRIWVDLPFLFEDTRSLWVWKSMEMSVEYRMNIASFLARMTASGVRGRDFGWCALWIVRETLEEKRPYLSAQDGNVAVVDLSPACFMWLKYSGQKLLQFSVENQIYKDRVDPGELARDAGVEKPGFRIARWLFWRKMYKELSGSEDVRIAEKGDKGFATMICTGRQAGYGFEIPGEKNYWEKVKAALTAELKRTRKDAVSDQDIIIDKNWADS